MLKVEEYLGKVKEDRLEVAEDMCQVEERRHEVEKRRREVEGFRGVVMKLSMRSRSSAIRRKEGYVSRLLVAY